MPHDWEGHPLRKSYPDRATAMPPYTHEDAQKRSSPWTRAVHGRAGWPGRPVLILNVGPHHTSTHGLIRFILALDGAKRSSTWTPTSATTTGRAEKIGERQSWHQFIPYTDRVDYLAGVANNLPYLLAVETLAGIKVPDRAQFIRVMLSSCSGSSNHLVWFSTLPRTPGPCPDLLLPSGSGKRSWTSWS